MRSAISRAASWVSWTSFTLAALVLATSVIAVWAIRALPWRNRCVEEPVAPKFGRAAVATSDPYATAAAIEILHDGGTAIDAAIAAALMLGVVEPWDSGLGGGGLAVMHDPKSQRTWALDFRERAPFGFDAQVLDRALVVDPHALRHGAHSVATPSAWAGLLALHREHGRLPLPLIAKAAVLRARQGFEIGSDYLVRCSSGLGSLRADLESRAIFLTRSGLCPLPGTTLVQTDLARTIEQLASAGTLDAFSEHVGRPAVERLARGGSAMSLGDFARAKPIERDVITGTFAGKKLASIGPPSSGGLIVIGWLQLYEKMRSLHPKHDRLDLWIEASRMSFFDRAHLMGDPDFTDVPVERLISTRYAEERAARFQPDRLLDFHRGNANGEDDSHTTHLSIVDQEGFAIAMTLTINLPFGSGITVPGTGVLLNDEMDDFSIDAPNAFGLIGGAANRPAPGKRPLSSMSPMIVFDGDEPIIVIGAAGGSRIPSAVAWVLREMLEDNTGAAAAVRSPRLHHQWSPDNLETEPSFETVLSPLLDAHRRRALGPIAFVHMVARGREGLQAVADCRDDGESWSGAH